jgi:glycolate oxidase FAD binding subunit
LEQDEAITRLNQWGGQPWPISASAWHDGALTVRLSGAAPAVGAGLRHLGGTALADDADFWRQVRDQRHPFFAGDAPLWRISVPSATPALALGGPQLVEWGGALRWSRSALDGDALREGVRVHGGHATLFRRGHGDAEPFQPLAPALAALHRNVKHAFDPAGVFNRGRMYKEF